MFVFLLAIQATVFIKLELSWVIVSVEIT